MKKIDFSNSKVSKVFSGKGFYIALCVCLIAVGVAGYVAYNQTVDKIRHTPSVSTPDTTSKSDASVNDVNKPQNNVPKDNTQTNAQPMIMPVTGEVTNPFSNGDLVKSATLNYWETHNGVDIKCDMGTPVKAMTGGTVTKIAQDAKLGAYVIIDHGNGIEGYYCNLNTTIPVKEGDKVSAGTVIGAVSNTQEAEIAEPSHLHFGLKQNGKWVDPIATINPGK